MNALDINSDQAVSLTDKWGREVQVSVDKRGWVYSLPGVEVILPKQDDARALDQFAMVNVPVVPSQQSHSLEEEVIDELVADQGLWSRVKSFFNVS
jgi:hypothetical protein